MGMLSLRWLWCCHLKSIIKKFRKKYYLQHEITNLIYTFGPVVAVGISCIKYFLDSHGIPRAHWRGHTYTPLVHEELGTPSCGRGISPLLVEEGFHLCQGSIQISCHFWYKCVLHQAWLDHHSRSLGLFINGKYVLPADRQSCSLTDSSGECWVF